MTPTPAIQSSFPFMRNAKTIYAGICPKCSDIADKICYKCTRCTRCGHKAWCDGEMIDTELK